MARTTIAAVVARQDATDAKIDALTAVVADLAAAIRGGAVAPTVAVQPKAARKTDFYNEVIVPKAIKRAEAEKPRQQDRKVANRMTAGMSYEAALKVVTAQRAASRKAHKAA